MHHIDVRTDDQVEVDVLVIGAGVAGLVTALDILEMAPRLRVAVLDKGRLIGGRLVGGRLVNGRLVGGQLVGGRAVEGDQPGGGGSTPLAQGGMAAAMGANDSPALHAADTMRAGDGLCDPRAVAVVTGEGPARVADLIRRGAGFDRQGGDRAPLALAREGGQSVARSVRTADATGAEIARALRSAASGRIRRIQGLALRLVTAGHEARVVGVEALLDETVESNLGPAQEAGVTMVSARATVLATGGCGGLFAATTNPDDATADGVALAYAAGAQLADMEFIQFHPTGLKPRDSGSFQRFLLTEALRGAGATLVDGQGTRFMVGRHPDEELAPRHVVTKAILDQPEGAWLDARGIATDQLREEFPTVLAGARRAGYDLTVDPAPVEPCEHYMIGGVATDLHGRTSVPGLWAAGEVACSGVHGANRMAGNSLLQASVFGHRVALDVVGTRSAAPNSDRLTSAVAGGFAGDVDVGRLRDQLRRTMSTGSGAIRTGKGLTSTANELARLRDVVGSGPFADRALAEIDNALTVGTLITEAALLRTESRGVHWRDDHPAHEPLWAGRHLRVRGPR